MSSTSAEQQAVAGLLAALGDRHPDLMLPDLSRMRDLVDLLGSPQRAYPSVHITGTNGKTTTARMVDALLRGAGLRTGRYTSPHLESVTERISLDGAPVGAERLAAAFAEIEPFVALVDARHPDRVTFFELLTALAFAVFADAPVQAAVVEVGLGGEWDATNVIQAPVAVLTTVDLDHTQLLGTTVEEIAAEKAGIVHPGAVVVSAPQPPGAARVLAERAGATGARLLVAGRDFGLQQRRVALGGQLVCLRGPSGAVYDDVLLPLFGAHQAGNAAVALAAAEAFLGGGARELDPDLVRAAFATVDSPGRLEVVRANPTVVLDAAHNPAGAHALAAGLAEAFHFEHVVAVLAVLADKDVAGILEALAPVVDVVVATQNGSARCLPAGELAELAGHCLGPDRVLQADDLPGALELARARAASPGSGVLVTGSVVTVGEARRALRAAGYDPPS